MNYAHALDKSKPEILTVNGTVYNMLASEPVDLPKEWEQRLSAYYMGWKNRALAAIKLRVLNPHQMKTIFDNKQHYKFYLAPDAHHVMEFDKPMIPLTVGSKESYDAAKKELEAKKGGWGDIYVSDDALVHHVKQRLFNDKVKEVLPKNLYEGLSHLGYLFQLDRDRAKRLFHNNSDSNPFFQDTPAFGIKPEEWEKQLKENQKYLAKQITSLAQDLTILQLVSQNMEEKGGWAQFHKDYEALVREECGKEGAAGTMFPQDAGTVHIPNKE